MTTRRNFLVQAGLVSAAAMLAPTLLSAKGKTGVGLQLYSLRDELPKDVKGVIANIAKAGYSEVETFGYSKQGGFWGLSAKEFSGNATLLAKQKNGRQQYALQSPGKW